MLGSALSLHTILTSWRAISVHTSSSYICCGNCYLIRNHVRFATTGLGSRRGEIIVTRGFPILKPFGKLVKGLQLGSALDNLLKADNLETLKAMNNDVKSTVLKEINDKVKNSGYTIVPNQELSILSGTFYGFIGASVAASVWFLCFKKSGGEAARSALETVVHENPTELDFVLSRVITVADVRNIVITSLLDPSGVNLSLQVFKVITALFCLLTFFLVIKFAVKSENGKGSTPPGVPPRLLPRGRQ